MTTTPPAPWERRPGEASAAFEAFALYRDLGPSKRSLDEVRQRFGRKPSFLRHIQRWSSRHEWVKRAAAWDDEQDRLAREATQRAKGDMVKRMQENAETFQRALSLPAIVLMERWARDDPAIKVALNKMSPADLLKLVALGARASKAAASVELTVTGHAAPGDDEPDEAGEDALAELSTVLERLSKQRGVKERQRKPAA